jgi:2-methylisocitrate lyase-like PEP mutase family enzyme
MTAMSESFEQRCEILRSLHVPGDPLVLPNAWDAASAQVVVAAGFPVVATTSSGVAASLGYEDEERAPAAEMLSAAARIVRSVDVPVTVDAEAGYALEPAELVAALEDVRAAGCNLEETDHATGAVKDPAEHAAWLRAVRYVATARGYPLVMNARIDVFLGEGEQGELVPEALTRARAYLEAGADCVYPIGLRKPNALAAFMADAGGPVNILAWPDAPNLGELGVARISYGGGLHRQTMESFRASLQSL